MAKRKLAQQVYKQKSSRQKIDENFVSSAVEEFLLNGGSIQKLTTQVSREKSKAYPEGYHSETGGQDEYESISEIF